MVIKKSSSISDASLVAARKRAEETRQRLQHKPAPSELLTRQERADAAPFYFVLREYIQELKESREAAGLTLADVSARTGMAVESLSRLETGAQTNPTWKTLGLYAKAVGRQPRLSAEAVSQGDEKSAEISGQSEREGSSASSSRIGKVGDYLESRDSSPVDHGTVAFLESIQIPEYIWQEPAGGWNFPSIRVFQVMGHWTQHESIELGDLTATIYARESEQFTDIVCLEKVEGRTQRLVQFAFRVFPDLCETPLNNLSPLDIVKRFADRYGLTIFVGSARGKFIEKQESLKRTILLPNESQPSIIHVDNPTNASCIMGASVKVDGDRVKVALGFCINTTDYWKWFNSHS